MYGKQARSHFNAAPTRSSAILPSRGLTRLGTIVNFNRGLGISDKGSLSKPFLSTFIALVSNFSGLFDYNFLNMWRGDIFKLTAGVDDRESDAKTFLASGIYSSRDYAYRVFDKI